MCTTPVNYHPDVKNRRIESEEKAGLLVVAIFTFLLLVLFSLFYYFGNFDENVKIIFQVGMHISVIVATSFLGGWCFVKKHESI